VFAVATTNAGSEAGARFAALMAPDLREARQSDGRIFARA
jgi:hypothetical protein